MLAALRSALFVASMAATVVPYALAVLLTSIVVRGDTLYWICAAWLRARLDDPRVARGFRGRLRRIATHAPPARR